MTKRQIKNVQQIEATAHEASVPVSVPQENRDKKEEMAAVRKLDLEKLRKKKLRKLRRSRRKLAKEITERDRFMQEVQKNNPEYFTRLVDRLP